MEKKNRDSKFFIPASAIKLLFLVFLFGGVPYIIATLFQKYEENAEGVVGQQTAVVGNFTERATERSADADVANAANTSKSSKEIKILTQEQVATMNVIRSALEGDWVSEQDGRYVLNIDSNSKFTEYYDNRKEGYGIWKVLPQSFVTPDRSSSDSVLSNSIENVTPSNADQSVKNNKTDDAVYIFQKEQYEPGHKGEVYEYQIQQLDSQKFIILFKGGTGKALVFVKSVSTQETAQ